MALSALDWRAEDVLAFSCAITRLGDLIANATYRFRSVDLATTSQFRTEFLLREAEDSVWIGVTNKGTNNQIGIAEYPAVSR